MEGSHPASDAELIDASRRGERAAFGALVERYANMVEAVSYAGTRDRTLGEDIAQDTFVAAWRELDRLRDTAAVKPWLCGIARNLARKARRRRGREVAAPEADAVVERTPFDVLHEGQAEQLVTAALARVPDTYREALVLFYYEQRSTRDVADALGITEEAVHKRLSRGRSFLAAGLEQSVGRALERKGSRRDLAAAVLGALPVTLAVAPSHADAATKGSSMWKIGALGIAATTVAVGTVVAWQRSDAKPSPAGAPSAPHPATEASAATPHAAPPPALPVSATVHATGDDGATDCAAVGRHMKDIAADDASDAWMGPMATSRFEQMCRDVRWSQSTLDCVLGADDAWNASLCKGTRTLASPPALAPLDTDVSCSAIAPHAVDVMIAEVASAPPVKRAGFEAARSKLTKMMEIKCAGAPWTETQRRCAAAATSSTVLEICTREAASPPTLAPATADASCMAVGKHVASLLARPIKQLPAKVPAEIRAKLTPSPADMAAKVETACSNGAWPDALRRCMLGATEPRQLTACQM